MTLNRILAEDGTLLTTEAGVDHILLESSTGGSFVTGTGWVVTDVFPDKKVQWSLKGAWQTQSDIIEAQGREQIRPRLPVPYRSILQGDLDLLNMAARAVVANFLKDRRGPYVPFMIFRWDPFQFENNSGGNGRLGSANYSNNYLIGPGDAATILFTLPVGNPGGLPALATTLQAAYVAGAQRPASIVVGAGGFASDQLQLTRPTAGTAVNGGAGGLAVSGVYLWTYTYIVSGNESYESPFFGVTLSGGATAANLSGIGVGPAGTTARKIYRTTNGTTTPRKFVATINDNTTTTYTDTLADASLGVNGPTQAPAAAAVIEADLTGRLRIPVRLMADGQSEGFVQSSAILGLRHLDVIEVL